MTLTKEGEIKAGFFINASIEVLGRTKKSIKNRQRVKIHLGTSITNAMVVMMESESLKPEDKGLVQLRLMRPVAAVPGDAFVISLMNVPTVIGGGNILEITDEKYRNAKNEKTLPYLKALQDRDLKNFINFLFESGKNALISPYELSKNTGFDQDEIAEEFRKKIKLGELVSFGNAGVFSMDAYKETKQGVMSIIRNAIDMDPLKKALNPEEIRATFHPPLHETPFQRMMAELCNEGKLVRVNGGVTTPDNSERLNSEQEHLMEMCLKYSRETDMVPFSGDTVWKLCDKKFDKRKIERILNYLHDQNRLVRLNDGRYLSPEAVNKIKERVAKVIFEKGEFTLGDLKKNLGYGRSVGVPVLEHLDTMAFTRREGNARVLMNTGD
jgi:selenocysteine-specific elongation factor